MNKFNSIFGQILKIFPRLQFEVFVKETGASRHSKGFSCWDQFVSMLFCQLGQAHTLREICGGLATSLGKIIHLGIHKAPSRSTLAYAFSIMRPCIPKFFALLLCPFRTLKERNIPNSSERSRRRSSRL